MNMRSSHSRLGLPFTVSVLLALSWFSTALLGQGGAYTIYGTVRLPDGSPAARVTVSLTGQSGISRRVFTDDMGRYEIYDLPRGRYILSAVNPDAPDQITDHAEADIARGLSSRIRVHLFLRVRSDETVETAASPIISAKEAFQKIPRAARRAFDQAIESGSKGKLDEAESNLSRALDLYPAYFQAWAERGHARLALGRTSEAAEDFARALEINPAYGPALRGAGICKFEQGKYEEAVRELESAAAAEPNSARTHLFLGIACMATNRQETARSALEKALSLDPNGAARARVHLADLAIKQNRLQEAVTQLRAYLAKAPDAPDADKLRALEAQLLATLQKP